VTDNSKFYRKSLHKIAPLSIFDVIITDLEKDKLASANLETTEVISLLCPIEEENNA
jgi:DeoR/GlpR family transcriptional regulator of sugar metabolism